MRVKGREDRQIHDGSGRRIREKLPAELVLIAAGFLGTESYVAKAFGVELNARTNVSTQEGHYATNVKTYTWQVITTVDSPL